MRWQWWQVVGVVVTTAICQTAAADVPSPLIALDAPGSCIDHAGFDELVAAHLGKPVGETRTPLDVNVVVGPSDTGWQARIATSTEAHRGERTIHGDDCAAVSDAAALVVALAILASEPPIPEPPQLPPAQVDEPESPWVERKPVPAAEPEPTPAVRTTVATTSDTPGSSPTSPCASPPAVTTAACPA